MCLLFAVCSANVCNYFGIGKNHAKKVINFKLVGYKFGSSSPCPLRRGRAYARQTYNVKRIT